MDHPVLKLSGLIDILDCCHENVWAEQDCYYFFDEIQYASDWDKWMKILYDTQPKTQMIATGSASPALVSNDRMAQQNMREDVADKVLKRDLSSLCSIRSATELERIFLYLLGNAERHGCRGQE